MFEMAARDVEMSPRDPLPNRVERLIDPRNPLGEFLGSIPGFHSEITQTESKDEAKYVEMQNLIAMTELLKTKYPQYDYSTEEVKSRVARRLVINGKIISEEEKYKAKVVAQRKAHEQDMRNLKREQQLLKQLEQIDDNLLIIDKEIEETNRALNAQAYKAARRQRLAAARAERDAAYAEALATQDARRDQEAKRRKSDARLSPPLPDLELEQVDEEYQYDPAPAFSAAA